MGSHCHRFDEANGRLSTPPPSQFNIGSKPPRFQLALDLSEYWGRGAGLEVEIAPDELEPPVVDRKHINSPQQKPDMTDGLSILHHLGSE